MAVARAKLLPRLSPTRWAEDPGGDPEYDTDTAYEGRWLFQGPIVVEGPIVNGVDVGGFLLDGKWPIYTTVKSLMLPYSKVGTLVADAASLLANAAGGRRRVRGWIDIGRGWKWLT